MENEVLKQSMLGDPFARDPPPPRAFYHPSQQKHLRNTEKKIALSPSRQTKAGVVEQTNPSDEAFLRGSNALQTHKTTGEQSGDNSSQFIESWTSSERLSYTSDHSALTPEKHHEMFQDLSRLNSKLAAPHRTSMQDSEVNRQSADPLSSGGSVLHRYIERFRHGSPMSRAERAKRDGPGQPDFWWLSNSPPTPSDTSTPKDDDSHPRSRPFTDRVKTAALDQRHTQWSSKQFRPGVMSLQSLSELPLDEETRRLQEKASMLLEDSASSFHSSEPIVSTDGLGSSSSFEDTLYRQPMAAHIDSRVGRQVAAPSKMAPPHRPTKPENDILFQWRLRRKMEVAQQGQLESKVNVPGSQHSKDIYGKLDAFRQRLAGQLNKGSSDKTTASMTFTPAPAPPSIYPRLQAKVDVEIQTTKSLEQDSDTIRTPPRERRHKKVEIASPTLPPHKQSERTDPHLHLMCDLIPCPHGRDYSVALSGEGSGVSEGETSSERDPVRYKQYLQAEKPHSEEKQRSHHGKPASVKSLKEGHRGSEHLVDFTVEPTFQRSRVTFDGETSDRNENAEMCDGTDSDDQREIDTDSPRCDRNSEFEPDVHKNGSSMSEHKNPGEVTPTQEVGFKDQRKYAIQKDGGSKIKASRENGSVSEIGSSGVLVQARSSSSRAKVPQPVKASSPAKATSVTSAIGKTISEHLFDRTSSTVISSVDSWASEPLRQIDHRSEMTAVHPLHAPADRPTAVLPPQPANQQTANSRHHDHHEHHSHDQEEAADYDSDGEFADDHILMMLRQQRTEYELKLRQTDDLLKQSSFDAR